ncbi:sigma-54-dependent transcriptional regulator [Urechidicola croceus]|uniref:Sigma-54-dependent Fis family transcriptional regulator n=1 Tax=Urechidicola croceus TaxID=1850246 RepID=A0A1D8P5M3_9FLAO|nr:sigma-54 dependent transcriptional regulator [Urechidicola croceus]AOW19879.1 sigma-54-dependent Fis family transcriptional regulator [Urechidicola croceus]
MLLKNTSILVVDDDVDVLTAMHMLLKSQVKEVETEKNPNNLISILQKKKFDLVILDMNFNSVVNTGNEGIYWLNKIKEVDKDIFVILITAYGDMDLAIKSLKNGASDFLVKPWKNEKLIESISEILKQRKSHGSKKWNPQVGGLKLLGESEVMKDVFFKINKIAPTDANILILGENGTGKDLIAKAIHDNSLRKNKPFIKVDVGALTSTLFESELFGHKKGAFTDAREDRIGRFEEADGGTLFLDEIGNISLQQQAKLLTVLQNRLVTPLGSNNPKPIDIRLICATNIGLEALADEANFRKDLIYRINTVEIIIPPLRDRDKDIELLAKHFVEVYAEKYLKSNVSAGASFFKKLRTYHFPGNVRELQYALERAVIMSDNDTLNDSDLVFSPIEKHKKVSDSSDLKLDTIEKNAILKVIEKNNGNISKSAKELGITRTALYRRLNKYGL